MGEQQVNQQSEHAKALLKARIAGRLRPALAHLGYPSIGSDAQYALAGSTGWSLTVIAQLLSGAVLPSIEQLIELSEVLHRPMAYWMLENEGTLPIDTQCVEPLAGGEDIALRLQDGHIRAEAGELALVYYYTPRAMGFGVDSGDSVVATACMPEAGPMRGCLYLFCLDDTYALRICVDANERGVFRCFDSSVAPLISMGTPSSYGFSVAWS